MMVSSRWPGPGPGARVAFVADLRDLRKIHRADQVGDVGGGRVVRRVGAHAHAAGFRQEDALDRHLHEVAVVFVREPAHAMRAELAADVDAVGLADLAAQRVRHQVQRRFVHRAAVDRIKRPGVGVAVLLQAPLEEDHERGLAAGGRPQQQKEPSANLGTRRGGLEIIDQTLDRVVDAVELVLEKLTAPASLAVVEALDAHHVPDILMAGTGDAARVGRENPFEEAGKVPGPACGAMLLAELRQRLEQFGMQQFGILLRNSCDRAIHGAPLNRRSTQFLW